jgi:hypothetical protein
MDGPKTACLAVLLGAIVITLYYATQNTDTPVPSVQGEAQMMGMGVQAGMALGAGTPIDMRPEVHFWSPGVNPRDSNPPCAVTTTRHRYPAVPGGNISTVMHKGYASLINNQPPDADWFFNPPEVAVM